jgi:hypothetical protein
MRDLDKWEEREREGWRGVKEKENHERGWLEGPTAGKIE